MIFPVFLVEFASLMHDKAKIFNGSAEKVLEAPYALGGVRSSLVVNCGLHLHNWRDFTSVTVAPLLNALDRHVRCGGLSFWMDTVAQHFGPSGLFELAMAEVGGGKRI